MLKQSMCFSELAGMARKVAINTWSTPNILLMSFTNMDSMEENVESASAYSGGKLIIVQLSNHHTERSMINEFSGFSVINIFENKLNMKCIKRCITTFF